MRTRSTEPANQIFRKWESSFVSNDRESLSLNLIKIPEVSRSGHLLQPNHEDIGGFATDDRTFITFRKQPDVGVPTFSRFVSQYFLLNLPWRNRS